MSCAPLFPRSPDPLRTWRRLAPERIALVDRVHDARISYGELDAAAERWAGALSQAGIRAGDRVAALSGNRRELVELFFACGRIGAALVPLNWRLSPAELGWVIGDARPALLLGEERFRSVAEEAIRKSSSETGMEPLWLDLDHGVPGLLLRRATATAPRAEVAPDDPALILYTSGSTGRPKGAILPHRQIFYNAVATSVAWELGPSDVAPISTPLFHTGGWNVFATPLWQRGGRVVLFDGFDPADFLDGLAEEGCTVALTVPTQLLMLAENPAWGRDLPALRCFFSGGAPCPDALAERTRSAGYRLRLGYGLTECGPNCFAIPDAEAVRRPGSVGWPVPFLEIRLVDDDGAESGPGEVGELCLRGPQMFGGYLNSPEATREAVRDGWFRTGDLARRDEAGAVTICGRRKEMYISGGENVFPGEVEAALADCPGVAEAVVVGVPDPRWGEVGRAFLVASADASVSEADVIEHARARLAGYKVPKSIVFVGAIPRLGSGKPDRNALASLARC